MFISLLVVTSLFLTLLDRLLHSSCGWSCGYTLKERLIFNPIDEIYLRLAKVFPVDFVILAILVLCNVMAHILLALCMALLTIAPNYTSFGSQMVSNQDGSPGYCSLEKHETKVACQVSVISAFFTRIAIAMPSFSVAYYFANWAFIFVFASVFTRSLLCQRRQPFLDTVNECEEEELGLLTS